MSDERINSKPSELKLHEMLGASENDGSMNEQPPHFDMNFIIDTNNSSLNANKMRSFKETAQRTAEFMRSESADNANLESQ